MNTIVQKAARIALCFCVINSGLIHAVYITPQFAFAAPVPIILTLPFNATTPASMLADAGSNNALGPLPPTAIKLASFTARRVNTNTVQIDWVTSLEQGTYGFRLLRSTTNNLVDAAYIMDLETARGAFTAYQHVDTSAPAGRAYYWIEETELGGALIPYGPVIAEAVTPETPPTTPPENPFKPRIFIPLVVRRR